MTLTDIAGLLGLSPAAVRCELVRSGLDDATISKLGRGTLSGDEGLKLMQILTPPTVREMLRLRQAVEDLQDRVALLEREREAQRKAA